MPLGGAWAGHECDNPFLIFSGTGIQRYAAPKHGSFIYGPILFGSYATCSCSVFYCCKVWQAIQLSASGKQLDPCSSRPGMPAGASRCRSEGQNGAWTEQDSDWGGEEVRSAAVEPNNVPLPQGNLQRLKLPHRLECAMFVYYYYY